MSEDSSCRLARIGWEARARARRSERGFTLVELMVVVAIVLILAMVAIVAYRQMVRSSHVSEATHMVQAIRAAQESYHAETLRYADVSTDTTATNLYPATPTTTNYKYNWGVACGSKCKSGITWNDIGVHTDGPVMFGYATIAGLPKETVATHGGSASVTINGSQTLTFPTSPSTDWFVVRATGNPDTSGNFTDVWGTSWSSDLAFNND